MKEATNWTPSTMGRKGALATNSKLSKKELSEKMSRVAKAKHSK